MKLVHGRTRMLLGLAVAATLAVAGCGGSSQPSAGASSASATSGGSPSSSAGSGGAITIGSANFPENVLLAEIYAGALRKAGMDVSTRLNIGSRETYLPALRDGSIDLIPEYTGNLLLYFNAKATATEPDAVYTALRDALPAGLTVLNKSSAEDKDATVVTRATAQRYHLTSIADLKPFAGKLTIGGSPEFKTRRAGLVGLQQVYGLQFANVRTLDTGGPLTVTALKSGQVDVAQLFTTDPAIAANDFVVLDDPKHIYIAQNVVPLLAASKVNADVRASLNAVSAALDTKTLAGLVARVSGNKEDPATVAAQWLKAAGLG